MPPVRFGVYMLAGSLLWSLGLAIAGYAVGRRWQDIAEASHGPTYVIAAVVVVAVVIVRWAHGRRAPMNSARDRRLQ